LSNGWTEFSAVWAYNPFIDDAHKLQGRKLQIARECALAARLWVVSASEEGRIGPSLCNVLMRRDPQLIRLDSEVAYDATAIGPSYSEAAVSSNISLC
jgi:hypothetical protein